VAPRAGALLARTVLAVARAVAALGAEGAAMAGTTLAYGLWYYVGVRSAAGSARTAFAGMRAYLVSEQPSALSAMGLVAKCVADIGADHAMLGDTDSRYRPDAPVRSVLGDAVQRIGFQLLIAYRLMRLCRQLRLGLFARICSRLMRHVYSADIHWDAEFAPGVVIVHGIGLVVSHAARVGTGCVLFQQVTLGESIHPVTRLVGAPTLEPHVHVAPGAVVTGPIVIGRQSKIAANAVVTASVPPRSVVASPAMVVRSRDEVSVDHVSVDGMRVDDQPPTSLRHERVE
jgi:serine acetyltransferase